MDCYIPRKGETKRLYRILVGKPLEHNHVGRQNGRQGIRTVVLRESVVRTGQVRTNLAYRSNEVTKFSIVVPNIFGFSVSNWHHVTFVMSRILLRLLDFWKILHPCSRNWMELVQVFVQWQSLTVSVLILWILHTEGLRSLFMYMHYLESELF